MRLHTLLPLLFLATPALADPAQILAVSPTQTGATWRFDVTLEHGDTGWSDYADGWRVELEDGTVLGTRVLHHPHVEEQPFTRTLHDVALPEGITMLYIRARTLSEGWSDMRYRLTLP